MIITMINKDLVEINDSNINSEEIRYLYEKGDKIHIIKLNFEQPEKYANQIIDKFPKTKRFIIEDKNKSVSYWNNFFKEYENSTGVWKKFYVENIPNQDFVRFFKRHNKIFLNMDNLSTEANQLVQSEIYSILFMIEIIQGSKEFMKKNIKILNEWRGNFVIN